MRLGAGEKFQQGHSLVEMRSLNLSKLFTLYLEPPQERIVGVIFSQFPKDALAPCKSVWLG